MYSLTKWAWTGALIRLVWTETWQQTLKSRLNLRKKKKEKNNYASERGDRGEKKKKKTLWGVKRSRYYYSNKTRCDGNRSHNYANAVQRLGLWWEIRNWLLRGRSLLFGEIILWKKKKKKATGVRGREQTEATAGKLPVPRKKTFLHVTVSWALGKPRLRCRLSPALFPRTAVCSNQRITGRSDQTGSGSERAAVGVEALVGGIALWSVYNSGVSVVARACLVNITGDKWNPDTPSRPADPCSSQPVSPRVTLPIRPNSSLHPTLDLPPHAHLPESEPDLHMFL